MTVRDPAGQSGIPSVVRPFAGLLVTPEWAGRVVSPMLDTLTAEEHARLLATAGHSWLQVTSPATAPSGGATTGDPPARGAAAFRALMAAEAFAPVPAGLYVYRLADHRGTHVGVVAAVDADGFATGRVRGHEGVQPERVAAMVRHFAEVPARSELVALLHARDDEVEVIVARTCARAPELDFTADDGLRQTVWRLTDSDAEALIERLGAGPLYVADGHHRVAASVRAWEEAGRPPERGVLCVLYPPDGLRLEAFHRRVVGPVDGPALVAALSAGFEVGPVDRPEPAAGRFAAYVDGRWYAVTTTATLAGVAGLDVTQLHERVLGPVLGVGPAGDPRLEVVRGTEPLDAAVARCDADGGALFALAPPTIAQLVSVADRGEVLTAKSTFFEPKPQAGIFVQVTG